MNKLTDPQLEALHQDILSILNRKELQYFGVQLTQETCHEGGHAENRVQLCMDNGFFKGQSTYYTNSNNTSLGIALAVEPASRLPIISSMVYTNFYIEDADLRQSVAFHMVQEAFDALNANPTPIRKRQIPVPRL
tara:strand:+ start:113 stop:517 length:405 start_codon:yes stop_codon:yes gene_type:complete